MSGSIRILPYSSSQQAAIDRMMAEIQEEFSEVFTSPGAKSIRELSRSPREIFWTAIAGEELAGTVGLVLLENNHAALKRMFVAKKFRGKEHRTAELLLQAAMQCVHAHGIRTLYLGTMQQFAAAQKFYLKHGFRAISRGELPPDFLPNPVDVVFYALDCRR